ncbi:IS1595 family transposase [Candidatus Thiosymbion oneisti]|uniref:IS1595 family transposase n=1 Tax=Candidatus Thiosymbion oneisti TaxID=589554 RepID=UPI000AAB0804|nr:IS1595 family transposase [Candidatus Thiosymbion oneisti]
MSRDSIQFQKGLSLPEFLEHYGSEQQCYDALFKLRWPDGFVCPNCGNTTHCRITSRKVYQCNRCHHQTTLTSGTLFASTKLPLTKWFLAIYFLTQRKTGLSALQLKRAIGVSYNTAWKLKHKLMQVMLEHQKGEMLTGRIEMDDAYIGGERPGKPGRGARHKAPFIAVVETEEETHRPQRMQLRAVKGFRSCEIERYASANLSPGCRVVSDGLVCFTAVEKAGCRHVGIVSAGGRKGVEHPSFKWVNTLLGNIKNAITGTLHSVSLKHVPRYLAEFEYRFNRRYRLGDMVERLTSVALRTPPMPYRLLRMAEIYG